MLNTTDFTNELKQIVDTSRPGERPFVCDGYPNECHVMIVGTNPATPLDMQWRDFWKSDYGFDYNLFVCKYTEIRAKIGRRYPLSKTRQQLIRISSCLHDVELKCIETNVYAREAKNEKCLCKFPEDERYPNDEVLDFLIKGLQPPKALIPHGQKAYKWLAKNESNFPADIQVFEHDHKLRHLSRASDITCIIEWVKSLA